MGKCDGLTAQMFLLHKAATSFNEEMRTFGYLCSACGKPVMGARSVFALEASDAEIACSCGKSVLRTDFDGEKYKIYVPCGICGENRKNLNYCKKHGIRLSGPALGRPQKGETRDKAQDYRDECGRVEVERRFSLAKRKCGMGLVTAKLRETAAHVIAMSILVLNLRKIQCAFLQFLTYLLAILSPKKNFAIIQ